MCIAHHECGTVGPPAGADAGRVGDHVEVAVAALPAGVGIPLDRIHLHVDGEQIVAGVAAICERAVQEELGVVPFAHQAPVVIGERQHDGVDPAGLDLDAEFIR